MEEKERLSGELPVPGEAETPAEPLHTEYAGRLSRLLLRGTVLGALVGGAAYLLSGWRSALGAVVGCLVAAVYAWGYLRSHVAHADRTKIFDPGLARQSTLRIVALAMAGIGMYVIGRDPFKGYLAGFAIAFAVLVATEAGAVFRQLRANRLMG
ncbi:MAG: hypothetical protein ACRDKW_15580 [Actinomycetota bacterium]